MILLDTNLLALLPTGYVPRLAKTIKTYPIEYQ